MLQLGHILIIPGVQRHAGCRGGVSRPKLAEILVVAVVEDNCTQCLLCILFHFVLPGNSLLEKDLNNKGPPAHWPGNKKRRVFVCPVVHRRQNAGQPQAGFVPPSV